MKCPSIHITLKTLLIGGYLAAGLASPSAAAAEAPLFSVRFDGRDSFPFSGIEVSGNQSVTQAVSFVDLQNNPPFFSGVHRGSADDRGQLRSEPEVTWRGSACCPSSVQKILGTAQFAVHDVVLSGPAGETFVTNRFAVDVVYDFEGRNANLEIHGSLGGGSAASLNVNNVPGTGGEPGGFRRYESTTAMLPLNEPLTFEIRLNPAVTGGALGFTSFDPYSRIFAVMTLPKAPAPVFILPPGYTANSPSLHIVDNVVRPPFLVSMSRSGNNLTFTWTGGVSPFTLECRTNLNPGTPWTPVSSISGNSVTLSNATTEAQAYYRVGGQ